MSGYGAGAAWKNRREEMGKTIEDAAAALRISHRYLRGIEEGKFDGWPEKVFSAGFIRSYAKYLSVDPAPVLAEYERTQEKAPREDETALPRPEWLERERERGSRKTSYIIAAAAVLLVGVVLAFFTMRGTEGPAPSPPAARTDNVPAKPSRDNGAAQPAPAPAAADTAAKADTAPRIDNAAQAPVAGAKPAGDNAAAAPGTSPPATISAGGGTGPLTGPFQLFLEASEHTWVMYSFDGGDPIDVTLYMGDKISIQATKSITLKIGNAGGVVGTLNGQRLPPFGKSGQVRNITFGQ